MAGLDPAIHVFPENDGKTWMPGTRPGMTKEHVEGARHEHHERRLLHQDSKQRESVRGSPGAEGARGLASRLCRLVERLGPRGLPAVAGLLAHRILRRSARLGQVRLCEDAR